LIHLFAWRTAGKADRNEGKTNQRIHESARFGDCGGAESVGGIVLIVAAW